MPGGHHDTGTARQAQTETCIVPGWGRGDGGADLGAGDERSSEADSLSHTPGEFTWVGGLESVEADQIDCAQRLVLGLMPSHPFGFESDLDVLLNRLPWEQRKGLEDHRCSGIGSFQDFASVLHDALGRSDKPCDTSENR